MLSCSQKKKSQFQNMDAYSVIDGLASNIKTLIEVLPLEDKETFAYLVNYPSEDTSPERVLQRRFLSNARLRSQPTQFLASYNNYDCKKIAVDKKGKHQPSFGCNCFLCYVFHWSRWDSSPNQGLIHEAILLYERAGMGKPLGRVLNRAEWKTKREIVKCCEARYLRSSSIIELNKADVNALYVQTSSALKLEELVSLEHKDCLTCCCEKVPAVEVVVDEVIFQRRESLEFKSRKQPSKEEIKPRKKKIVKRMDASLKGGTCLRQEMHHLPSSLTEDIPTKNETKKVAATFFIRGYATTESPLEPNAELEEEEASDIIQKEPQKAQISLSHVFSVIVSFVAERFFGMWYPRIPRGISVF